MNGENMPVGHVPSKEYAFFSLKIIGLLGGAMLNVLQGGQR